LDPDLLPGKPCAVVVSARRTLAVLVPKLLGRRRLTWSPPMLDDWCAASADPDSGVWALTPPCWNGVWKLWAPGSADPYADFPYSGEPHTQHPARGGEDDLGAIIGWLLPWLEDVTGGRVADALEGWCAPYRPERDCRRGEYVIYVRVVNEHAWLARFGLALTTTAS